MKSILTGIVVLLLAFSFIGCEEKTDAEKVQESMKNMLNDTKDAIHEATE